ncbi:MAG: hypothetical protein IH865_00770 [Chloroflexi bacterium]|nr:hypothetical protein [Chloroflexota bacterium]
MSHAHPVADSDSDASPVADSDIDAKPVANSYIDTRPVADSDIDAKRITYANLDTYAKPVANSYIDTRPVADSDIDANAFPHSRCDRDGIADGQRSARYRDQHSAWRDGNRAATRSSVVGVLQWRFRGGGDGEPHAWKHFGGVLMQTGTPARTGSWAGALFSSTDSTKWAFQTVNVEPAGWYEFHAFVYHDDPWVESALLRISWYASANGSGSAVAAVDSTDLLASPAPEFRRLSTGPEMAPPGVHSAKVRVLMRPRDGTSAVIYIDDASFDNVAAPIPPTSTPTLAPPTTTPTPASTSTNTPTAQPTTVPASPAPADTPQPADTPPPADTATPVPAATATNASTSTPEPASIPSALTNAGFESAVEGVPVGWRTFGGLLMQVDSPVRSGAAAGGFFSSSGSTKWIYQTVAVEPAAWYQFDAFVYHNHAFVDEALLRISWYASADGSGSALASVDSTGLLASPEARYRPLTTGPVQAPPGARSAKLRILMRPRDERSALINVDDVSFGRVAAPAVAPSTPAPVSAAASSRVLSSFEPAAPSVSNQRPATTNQRPATTNERPSHAPMPAPVLRRHALQTPEPQPDREGDPLWPWALLGATAGAGVVGWAAYWALRRRRDAVN